MKVLFKKCLQCKICLVYKETKLIDNTETYHYVCKNCPLNYALGNLNNLYWLDGTVVTIFDCDFQDIFTNKLQ